MNTASPGAKIPTLAKQLALVIDHNVCVGCHACVTSCKQWNTSGAAGPLVDDNPYGAKCIGCKYCSWACPYGAREFDEERSVMTKCTLCVDRIYDTLLLPQDRKPACVKACPTGARLFGDVNDPESDVSKAIRDAGGYALMPEWDTKPANRYLPRRITETTTGVTMSEPAATGPVAHHAASHP